MHALRAVSLCLFFGGLYFRCSWWRHQMETFSVLLAICAGNSPVTGEFSAQRPVTQSFDVFFDLRLNKRLSKQSWWGWWFETLSRPLWRHYNIAYSGGLFAHILPGYFHQNGIDCSMGPILQTWIKLNLSMDYIHYKVWDKVIHLWEWIRNFIPHINRCVIIYPILWQFTTTAAYDHVGSSRAGFRSNIWIEIIHFSFKKINLKM